VEPENRGHSDKGKNAMDLGLHDKHAIVTGGSRGIGKAIARELAREGADVAIVARNKGDLEATARELATETNQTIAEDEMAAVVEEAHRHGGSQSMPAARLRPAPRPRPGSI
jgi:NAD(P)-dependent dehydrogenase (short-subunit alcohol dehydrogenase family)